MSKVIGQVIEYQKEDKRYIVGKGKYVEDISIPGMLWISFVRSPHAHANILSIDKSAAEKHPEVISVLSAEDLIGKCKDIPGMPFGTIAEMQVPSIPVLARKKVFQVGQPVVAVIASSRYVARDAVDLVEVQYDTLQAIVDPEDAMKPNAPIIHDDLKDNRCFKWSASRGNVSDAFEKADVIVRERILNNRVAVAPIEPRGCVADWNAKDKTFTIWVNTQHPNASRAEFSELLGIPMESIRVITQDVGGAFGAKQTEIEAVVTCAASVMLAKPVKWIASRAEEFQTMNIARGKRSDIELAATKEGKLTGLRFHYLTDLGAYCKGATAATHALSAAIAPGAYDIPNIELEVESVYTTKVVDGAYRGYGRPEGIFVIERAMAMLANKLGLDQAELRRRNFISKDAFPYKTVVGEIYDSGNYEAALDQVLELSQYKTLRKEQDSLRKDGRLIGIGVSSYVKSGGAGPHPKMGMTAGWEVARLIMSSQGKLTIVTGTAPHGQGIETSFAMISAEILQIPIDDINVQFGDTAIMPYGQGTGASHSLPVGGPAVYKSSHRIRDKMHKLAAHKLGLDVDSLIFDNGKFTDKKNPKKTITIQEVAKAAYYGAEVPPDMEPGLEDICFFHPSGMVFSFGSHICQVEVDPETGEVKIIKYFAVGDPGKIINPVAAEGQEHGGTLQAIGQALYEEVVHDSNGQILTGSFMDYALPNAEMTPNFITDHTETISPMNPLGSKGYGEAATTGATPAVANAVMDALKPLGITHIQLPITSQKVWGAIKSSKSQK